MTNIYLDNIYLIIENIPREVELKIREKLSFSEEEYGCEYPRIRYLYNMKLKKTYVGLLPYVLEILEEEKCEYNVLDKRVIPKKNAKLKLVKKIGNKKLEARPYQQEVIDRVNPREVITAATGAGKTFMMAGIMAKINTVPIAVFADKLSLCTQLKEEFEKFLGVKVGLVGGGIYRKEDITVYSIQSVKEEDIKDAKVLMFDECLDENTLITLADNTQKTIKEIVENKIDCDILTYNTDLDIIEIKKVYDWFQKEIQDRQMYEIIIEDENGNEYILNCTHNHKIFSNNQYIATEDLEIGMEVILNNE